MENSVQLITPIANLFSTRSARCRSRGTLDRLGRANSILLWAENSDELSALLGDLSLDWSCRKGAEFQHLNWTVASCDKHRR